MEEPDNSEPWSVASHHRPSVSCRSDLAMQPRRSRHVAQLAHRREIERSGTWVY
jgi:hypothetical protein